MRGGPQKAGWKSDTQPQPRINRPASAENLKSPPRENRVGYGARPESWGGAKLPTHPRSISERPTKKDDEAPPKINIFGGVAEDDEESKSPIKGDLLGRVRILHGKH